MACALLWRRQKKRRVTRRFAAEDKQLWVGLAAGLFDHSDRSINTRMETALTALVRKLRLKAGMVSVHGENGGEVIAVAGCDASEREELEQGKLAQGGGFFYGHPSRAGQLLAIDYASLSEWRKHPACREQGWEAYLGLNCGERNGRYILVSFFDYVARDQLFSQAEKTLVEQLGPWIAAMVIEKDFVDAADGGFVYAMNTAAEQQEA